jgi:hypothetical protein
MKKAQNIGSVFINTRPYVLFKRANKEKVTHNAIRRDLWVKGVAVSKNSS